MASTLASAKYWFYYSSTWHVVHIQPSSHPRRKGSLQLSTELSKRGFSNLNVCGNLLGILWKVGSDWAGLGWKLRVCVPNKLLGDARTAVWGPQVEKQVPRGPLQIATYMWVSTCVFWGRNPGSWFCLLHKMSLLDSKPRKGEIEGIGY